MTGEKKQRLQFDFTPEMVERLDKCVELLEAGSRAEAVRRAVNLMRKSLGGEVFIRDSDGRYIAVSII